MDLSDEASEELFSLLGLSAPPAPASKLAQASSGDLRRTYSATCTSGLRTVLEVDATGARSASEQGLRASTEDVRTLTGVLRTSTRGCSSSCAPRAAPESRSGSYHARTILPATCTAVVAIVCRLGSPLTPLGAGVHGGSKHVLLAGLVRADVAIYELRYENGEVERVEPVESFVLHQITPRHYARGHRLELIRALDRNGAVLARQTIRTDAPGVYPCEKPVDIGHGVRACP